MFGYQQQNTIVWLKEQLGNSLDVVVHELKAGSQSVNVLYISSICDEKLIQANLILPLFETETEREYITYLFSQPNVKSHKQYEETLKAVMNGSVFVSTSSHQFLFISGKSSNKAVGEATVETVIQGPQSALSEDKDTNLNLIRNRYPRPTLRIEEKEVGKLSNTKISLLYDQEYVNEHVLKEVKNSLEKIEIDVLQAAGQLHQKLTKSKRTLFPTMMITERPDRIVFNLAQGKIVLLIDGTPFAVILPAVFYDFISSMEDLYQTYWVSKFIVFLRYMGLFISLILPAMYVGVTAFNPEIFRVQLALSIAGSRVGVPYPAFLEVLLMLLMMELLTEASVRLPKAIGSTATTVGGLILGQAAVEAGLVSNVMIIIVAAVAISNFVIPINSMSFAMRVVKYVLLLITSFLGMVGLVIGIILLICYLTSLKSFGEPYLKVFMEPKAKDKNMARRSKGEVGSP
ncbi:spore germination protein [Bacillus suaedaesalsae]|uniref:Spore germination protein n=1 Tax=Bacillus suaedaesalsae TaxID=2810349 RepID=A0ABS2DF12_9BACI|nr:spore germination protein [Bacillus suaedaesalsae]MBM6617062.1 spore germination protein [Bacillus suaedaesalsae]